MFSKKFHIPENQQLQLIPEITQIKKMLRLNPNRTEKKIQDSNSTHLFATRHTSLLYTILKYFLQHLYKVVNKSYYFAVCFQLEHIKLHQKKDQILLFTMYDDEARVGSKHVLSPAQQHHPGWRQRHFPI